MHISRQNPKKKHITPTQQVVLASVLFVVSLLLAGTKKIGSIETSVFNLFYGLPEWLLGPMLLITQLGSVLVLFILTVFFFLKRDYRLVIRLLLTASLAYLFTGVAKDLWGRGRPYELLPNITNLEHVVRGAGFPSGHVALATAIALTLAHFKYPKYRMVFALWIVLVAISRMYLGVHAPLDIVGGFAIGWGAFALFSSVRLYELKNDAKKIKKNKTRK